MKSLNYKKLILSSLLLSPTLIFCEDLEERLIERGGVSEKVVSSSKFGALRAGCASLLKKFPSLPGNVVNTLWSAGVSAAAGECGETYPELYMAMMYIAAHRGMFWADTFKGLSDKSTLGVSTLTWFALWGIYAIAPETSGAVAKGLASACMGAMGQSIFNILKDYIKQLEKKNH